jgi:cellobiose-specific phosphotransferase system component IIB
LVEVFVVCGAGASSTFLCIKLRSLAQNHNEQIKFVPAALETVNAGKDQLVVVASHIAADARVANLSKSGVQVLKLNENGIGSIDANTAFDAILGALKNHQG